MPEAALARALPAPLVRDSTDACAVAFSLSASFKNLVLAITERSTRSKSSTAEMWLILSTPIRPDAQPTAYFLHGAHACRKPVAP